MKPEILIIDDEPNIILSFSSLLKDEGYSTTTAKSAEEGLRLCHNRPFDIILLDLQLPGISGIEFLKELDKLPSAPLVLVVSGQADIPMALDAVRLGAIDFLEKPVPPEKLIAGVKAAAMLADADRQRRTMVNEIDNESTIVGRSTVVMKLFKVIDQVAPTDTTVLITGENGTGKELVATRVYLGSKRRGNPFVKVNCPGIPETLFESELFGHVKGAFTGAVKDYPGKFALADRGTIFLDEIGDLPLNCQAKLLRVLETGEVETLGSADRRMVDTRVICATNRDLRQLVTEGKFREDLYYRISVFMVDVPSLAQRRDDIPILAGEFLRRFDPTGKTRLSSDAMALLSTVDYPGNVRQLKNTIERLTILHPGQTIQAEHLEGSTITTGLPTPDQKLTLAERMANYEKTLISQTLEKCDGNISEAARILGVNRANLSRKIKELGLKNP